MPKKNVDEKWFRLSIRVVASFSFPIAHDNKPFFPRLFRASAGLRLACRHAYNSGLLANGHNERGGQAELYSNFAKRDASGKMRCRKQRRYCHDFALCALHLQKRIGLGHCV